MTVEQLKSEGWHAALASSTRRRVLELLVTSGKALDAVAVAEAISLHVTTARFHLEQLEAVGLVQRAVLRVPGQRGRPRVLFSIPEARPGGVAGAATGTPQVDMQEQLSRALISVLGEDADGGRSRAIRAGENWSTALPERVRAESGAGMVERGEPRPPTPEPSSTEQTAPAGVGAVRRTRTAGAGPYLTVLGDLGFAPELQGERVVALHECPFRAEARANPGVVCSVHLGLMRGVARSLGQNEDEVALHPFVTPTLCLVDLPETGGAASAIK
ncbi:hypothetical protein D6T64_04865 [Cryobacterium melibiosiphilum]|uniref:ArsR family transcriptional regulator n=1 Tax=Cryobacterium melibiosiphilum TaxID=995039 RepID=A0A3A5MIZ1_9MICO|nr:helix-turn-helix domain-containing protein [Cryobacterium melibiosiphilum]RJT90130.1 hypothetical protein D6T64_04865 [Cryobacterium melibiosiphilum]